MLALSALGKEMGKRISKWKRKERNRALCSLKVSKHPNIHANSRQMSLPVLMLFSVSVRILIMLGPLWRFLYLKFFRYIDDPLLIGGKKFDLRLYVVVVSYRPLKAYLSDLGFARFCNIKYTTEAAEMDNQFVHLTNVAIQRRGVKFNSRHGNKWPLQDLKIFLESTHEKNSVDKLFMDLELAIINSLRSVQNVMINDSHCFELYGYDMIIDSSLKPWLIEVDISRPRLISSACNPNISSVKWLRAANVLL